MAETTKVEWADATLSMWWGCTKVSPACKACYAESWAKRWGKNIWGPGAPRERKAGAEKLARKLNRQAEREGRRLRVFSASMSDWLDPEVPAEWLADLLALVGATPALDWLLLTKRPHLWRDRLAEVAELFEHENAYQSDLVHMVWDWQSQKPPPNVWVGATVEDQERADERIPALLEIPARVRFLSCEPLLGPLDLTRWIPPLVPVRPEEAPEAWDAFQWAEWVPENVRRAVAEFWGPEQHRRPRDWLADALHQGSPPFGARFVYRPGEEREAQGRWVHCWNNVGRLIGDDGVARFASFGRGGLFDFSPGYHQPFHQIIAGGESGRGARPSHPDWFRSLRDQAQAAGVAFFFKQWGEWVDAGWKEANRDAPAERACVRVGKAKAGRLLDGREWNEVPRG